MICLLDFLMQEDINEYDILATNSRFTKIQDGTKIMGALTAKENILVWTDNSLYTMKFVGAPFTFGFEQVGTNCGLIGKNAAIEIDGVAYWMSNNGFFAFDGTVNSLPCQLKIMFMMIVQLLKVNKLMQELIIYLQKLLGGIQVQGADFNDRSVTYNYGQTINLLQWVIGIQELMKIL